MISVREGDRELERDFIFNASFPFYILYGLERWANKLNLDNQSWTKKTETDSFFINIQINKLKGTVFYQNKITNAVQHVEFPGQWQC